MTTRWGEPNLQDLAIIGNCQYSALIDTQANVRWMCWPNFDASFVFGSLVDQELGGYFAIQPAAGGSSRSSAYLTNTTVLRHVFEAEDGRFELIDFAPRFFQHDRLYKPPMLVRLLRPLSGQPLVRVSCQPYADYGRVRLTPHVDSGQLVYRGGSEPIYLLTEAPLTAIVQEEPFILTQACAFVLSWGSSLDAPLAVTSQDYFHRTVAYWQRWVKHCHLPATCQKEVIRSALTLKLHQYEDTGAVIAATTTSIPEATATERNWDYRYCWLRDAYFTVGALQRLSHFEELEGYERYLRRIATLNPWPLQPLYSIAGQTLLHEETLSHLRGYRNHAPVRVGNDAYRQVQHDLYGEMVLAISPLFTDVRFMEYHKATPDPLLEQLLSQMESRWQEHDAGIWEFRGTMQLHTFTLLMHWAGADRMAAIGEQHHYTEFARRAARLRDEVRAYIETYCWNENLGIFTQASGNREFDASLLMMVNLKFLRPDDPRAKRMVAAMATALGTASGFIRRYTHRDDFGDTHNAFLVCSFWLAEAYARLGMREEGVDLFNTLLGAANRFGLFSEDIDPQRGELWGNFPQTYSHVGVINTAFALFPTDM